MNYKKKSIKISLMFIVLSLIFTSTVIAAQNNQGIPPQESINACKDKSAGDSCEFEDKDVVSVGVCDNKPGVLACAPQGNSDGDERAIEQKDTEVEIHKSNNLFMRILFFFKSLFTSEDYDLKDNRLVDGSFVFEECIYNTKDAPECKDCCDCLSDSSGETRTSCRDTCATHDFSTNSDFITVSAKEVLGANGDYLDCTKLGDSQKCKSCCEDSGEFSCGDYRHCRTACNNELGDSKNSEQSDNYYDPSKTEFNVEQAISERAQSTTIAYSALAFFTGNTCADSFIPPGKVADYFGFQYLRDNAVDGMGHSTDFVTNSGNSLLYILDDDQEKILSNLIESQDDIVNEYAYSRYPLLIAFRMQLEGDTPNGKTILSKDAVIDYSEELYLLDAKISIQRAEAFGKIIRSLSDEQKELLDSLVEKGFYSWTLKEDVEKKELMGIASELFGWYAGNVEADTYFCPERHGTYFGSFYMKDAPAMAAQAKGENYIIDETITGNKGEILLNMLESKQSELISELTDIQSDNLQGIVDVREAISKELRNFMIQDTIDEDYVYELAKQYGTYDGENVYYYAMHFSEVMESLTDSQMDDLMELRDLDEYICDEDRIYIYSNKFDVSSIDSNYFEEPVFLFE